MASDDDVKGPRGGEVRDGSLDMVVGDSLAHQVIRE
jgi:hypothetical protein